MVFSCLNTQRNDSVGNAGLHFSKEPQKRQLFQKKKKKKKSCSSRMGSEKEQML